MTERCIRFNAKCEFAKDTNNGIDCAIRGTLPCHESIVKERKKFLKYNVKKFGEGTIKGGKVKKG